MEEYFQEDYSENGCWGKVPFHIVIIKFLSKMSKKNVFSFEGRGVKTCKPFQKGDFLLHYAGESISGKEGDKKEEIHSSGYRFFFKAGGKQLW